MSDFRDLYQQVIMDHNKSPRNFKKLEDSNRVAIGHNPLCGDQCTIYLHINDDQGDIQNISFQGIGCAISKASASIMTSILKKCSLSEAEQLFNSFHKIVTGELEPEKIDTSGKLKKLSAFFGVRDFPARVKCATLPWHTLNAAINKETQTISTE